MPLHKIANFSRKFCLKVEKVSFKTVNTAPRFGHVPALEEPRRAAALPLCHLPGALLWYGKIVPSITFDEMLPRRDSHQHAVGLRVDREVVQLEFFPVVAVSLVGGHAPEVLGGLDEVGQGELDVAVLQVGDLLVERHHRVPLARQLPQGELPPAKRHWVQNTLYFDTLTNLVMTKRSNP